MPMVVVREPDLSAIEQKLSSFGGSVIVQECDPPDPYWYSIKVFTGCFGVTVGKMRKSAALAMQCEIDAGG